MTATSSIHSISAEYMTETAAILRAQVVAGHRDVMPILADALQDAGCEDTDLLDSLRDGSCQTTEEGERIATVGRDGADHDRHGNGIYTTKVYEAARRQRDGCLTWRLVFSLRSHRTSGKAVSGPMLTRAKDYAAESGLRYDSGIIHGMTCR